MKIRASGSIFHSEFFIWKEPLAKKRGDKKRAKNDAAKNDPGEQKASTKERRELGEEGRGVAPVAIFAQARSLAQHATGLVAGVGP